MREIEYRAWLKGERKMVEVKTIHFGTRKIMYGYSAGSQNYGNASCGFDDCEIMQFTGLKDRNGAKVYEGDIVKIGSQIGYIVYNYGSFGIGLSEGIDYKKLEQKTLTWLGIENDNFLPLLEVSWNFNDEDEILSKVKVIGNRYDNPELIKESESDGRGE